MAARSPRNLVLTVVKSAILEMFLAQVGVGKINSRFYKLSPKIDDGSGCDAVSDFTDVLEEFLSQVSVGTISSGVKQLSPEIDDTVLGSRGVLLGYGEC